MESIDTSEITDSYSKEGGKLFSPRYMIAVLLYAYSKGVTSSYKIAKLIESNIDYIFLAGGQKISRRTISDFRRKNADKLQKILTSTVIKSIRKGDQKRAVINVRFGRGYLSSYQRVPAHPP